MADRNIEYVRLETLKGDPRNPKSHDLATIDSSYSRFGVVDLITVDGRTGYIASGHGRTTALKDAYGRGEEAPEGIKVDGDGMWLVPVNAGWSSKNDAEAAAALIAMNRVTEMGGWVDQSLLDLLKEVSASGAGFEGIGFSETDLDDLQHLLEDQPDLDALAEEWNEDDVPNSGGSSAVTVKLTDPAVIDAWHTLRDRHKKDDDAARELFGLAPAPKPEKKRKSSSRAKDPSLDDLAPDGAAAASSVLDGLADSSQVENPVENAPATAPASAVRLEGATHPTDQATVRPDSATLTEAGDGQGWITAAAESEPEPGQERDPHDDEAEAEAEGFDIDLGDIEDELEPRA